MKKAGEGYSFIILKKSFLIMCYKKLTRLSGSFEWCCQAPISIDTLFFMR